MAWLVCRVVGLFTPLQIRQQTNHAHDFVKAVARENLCWQAAFPKLQQNWQKKNWPLCHVLATHIKETLRILPIWENCKVSFVKAYINRPLQFRIDLVTVLEAILTSRQKLQCFYENPMSNTLSWKKKRKKTNKQNTHNKTTQERKTTTITNNCQLKLHSWGFY